jgi:hypothetical protein
MFVSYFCPIVWLLQPEWNMINPFRPMESRNSLIFLLSVVLFLITIFLLHSPSYFTLLISSRDSVFGIATGYVLDEFESR